MQVACGIMKNKNGQILLGLRPDDKPDPGYWEFPGGKKETNESIDECLKREWIEELELNIEILKEVVIINSGKYICTFFEGKILNEDKIKVNVHKEIGFFCKDEIRKMKLFEEDYSVIDKISDDQ